MLVYNILYTFHEGCCRLFCTLKKHTGASSELSGTAHRPALWVHLLFGSYNNTWCSAWKSQTRGNAENEMRPLFGFCSHPLSTPRRRQRWENTRVRPAGGPSGSGGQVQVGTHWALWGTSASCPPSAHQLNFLRRFCLSLRLLPAPGGFNLCSVFAPWGAQLAVWIFKSPAPSMGDQPSFPIYWAFDFLPEYPLQILYSSRKWAETMAEEASG